MGGEAERTSPRRFRFNLLSLFVLTAFVAFCSCVCVTVTRKIELKGVTPAEANDAFAATITIVRVPSTAHNVDVFAYFQSGQAAFDIGESDFLDYARDRWELAKLELNPNEPAHFQLEDHLHDWPQYVEHIWYFTNASHRGGWTVMYDRDRKRAYVFYAHR